ncbi:MAG: hypothetical protein MUP47_03015 [Phycisphaerae bacterium]|nr:hypothetical protein [Phycisphaerae bacterium]
MLNITPPPPPQLAMAPTLGIAAVGVVLGGALVLWGRVLNRSFLAAVGAAAGVVLADRLARQFGLPVVVVGVVVILSLAALAAIAARIIWPLAGGALFGLVALGVLLSSRLEALPPASQPTFQAATVVDFPSWLIECRRFLVEGVGAVWPEHSVAVLWVLCLGGGVPLVALLLLPRLGKIFMTGLIGSVGVVGGILLAVSRAHRASWPTHWSGYLVWGGAVLVLLVISLVYQYCGDVAARQARKARQDKAGGAEGDAKRASKKSAFPGRKG